MGQQKGNHEATGPRGADSNGAQGPQDRSLVGCLDELLHALDLHRLCFLFFAEALRVNPHFMGNERVKKPKLLGQIRKEDMDDGGEFLLRYRDEIERFAEAAINDFGHGKGQKPIEPYDEDTWCDVKGSSYPSWKVYLQVIGWVQKTSDGVVEACGRLSQAGSTDGDAQIVNDTLQAVWPHGTAKWYAARSIPWDYLERMDIIITLLKEAIATVKDVKTQIDKPDAEGAEGSGSNAIDTRTKRKRPTKIERKQGNKAVAVAASGEKRESESQEVDGVCNASEANVSGRSNVNIQNSNVIFGSIHQPQSLSIGDHSSIGKETPTPTAIVASWLGRHVKALLYRIWKHTWRN